jgi:hypothetical protein
MFYYNGLASPDGPWVAMNASTEAVQDIIGASVAGGTALTRTYNDTTGITTLSLNNTEVTAGSYGSQTKIPTFTVDAQGRLTAAGEVDVATTLTISDDTSATIGINLLTETLEVNGGEGIDVAVTGDSIIISGEDATSTNKGIASFSSTDFVVTSGAVTLNTESVQDIVGAMVTTPNTESGISVTYDDTNGKLDFNVSDPVITLSGDVTGSATMTNLGDVTITTTVAPNSVALGADTTGDYVSTIIGTANEVTVAPNSGSNAAVTIGLPDDVTISGNLQVNGNLNVQGTLNAVNTTEIDIADNTIRLNTGFAGTPVADAGIIVERGTASDVSLVWKESASQWQLTNNGSNFHGIARKYAAVLSDSLNTYTVTHNLGTSDVTVQIYESASPFAQVEADVKRTSANVVTVDFAQAPTAGQYKIVIVG